MRFCAAPDCPARVPNGYCPSHKPVDARPTAEARGYDSKWRKLSKTYIAAHPLCQLNERCKHPTLATEVDHILPIRTHPELRLVWSNLQSLCHPCHVAKTWRES